MFTCIYMMIGLRAEPIAKVLCSLRPQPKAINKYLLLLWEEEWQSVISLRRGSKSIGS